MVKAKRNSSFLLSSSKFLKIETPFAFAAIKKIIKNSKYNYQVFLAKDLNVKDLNKFEIKSQRPEILDINGLSSFLSQTLKLNVKIVNKDVILFKAIDNNSSYSESGIIDRKTGELVHEITKNIKSENSEKDITFYSCSKRKNV